ncbi:MAG TPA: hypothetical protein VF188_02485 [Longimicrobiales bacterium]
MPIPKVRGLGLRANGPFWASYARSVWLPQIQVLSETVVDRALPAFAEIEREAELVSEERWVKLSAFAGPDTDPADLADAARDAGVIYYQLRSSARQALVNLFCVALHHLVEQQLLTLLRRELLPMSDEDNRKLLNRPTVVAALRMQGIDVEGFPEWKHLDELRLVANVVKHAEGDSSDKLKDRRPDLFTPEILRGEPGSPPFGSHGPVLNPMSGDDLYISDNDLADYFTFAEGFWRRLAEAMEALASRS